MSRRKGDFEWVFHVIERQENEDNWTDNTIQLVGTIKKYLSA